MDEKLLSLKRACEANPSHWGAYKRALERACGFNFDKSIKTNLDIIIETEEGLTKEELEELNALSFDLKNQILTYTYNNRLMFTMSDIGKVYVEVGEGVIMYVYEPSTGNQLNRRMLPPKQCLCVLRELFSKFTKNSKISYF